MLTDAHFVARINRSAHLWRASALLVLTAATFALTGAADAGALSSAARAAIARRTLARETAQVAVKPRDVIISRARYPQSAAHIEHAQKNGQPTVLRIDRSRAARQRAAATGTVNRTRKPGPAHDRDEYPPAFTREGGSNANVRWIPTADNRGAGASMGSQIRSLPDGSKIRVLVR